MENSGDDWHRALAKRVGEAVAARRKELKMTAQQLAGRCTELGVPIHRTTVTKVENGRPRFDLGELIVLAAALDIPPVLLLFPGYPDGTVEVLPGHQVPSRQALDWATGSGIFPPQTHPDGRIEIFGGSESGIELIAGAREQQEVERDLFFREINSRSKGPQELKDMNLRMAQLLKARLAALPAEIEAAKTELWGRR